MTNWKKRSLSLFMALVMVLCLLPVSAFAQTEQEGPYLAYDDKGVAADTAALPESLKTIENGAITMQKNIDQKGEDEFDINLIVTTTEKLEEVPLSQDAAVVLVLDTSGSMKYGDDTDYNVDVKDRRITAAVAAAQKFVTDFGAGEAGKRMISVLGFATSAAGDAYEIAAWADVNHPTQGDANRATVVAEIGKTPDYVGGNTNTESGLSLANDYLQKEAVKGISSRFVILLTDGQPNRADSVWGPTEKEAADAAAAVAKKIRGESKATLYTMAFATSTETCYTTSDCALCGDSRGEHDRMCSRCSQLKSAHYFVERCKECDVTKDLHGKYCYENTKWYTYDPETIVYCNSNKDKTFRVASGSKYYCVGTKDEYTNKMTVGRWLQSIASPGCYKDATKNEDVSIKFTEISEQIRNLLQAWQVTDPMGDFINFVGLSKDNNNVTLPTAENGNKLVWNLWEEKPELSQGATNQDPNTYKYSLTYRIKLDTSAVGFQELNGDQPAYHPTNQATSLSYATNLLNADGSLNTSAKVLYNYFNVPTVMGTVPSYDYKVEYYYQDSKTGDYPQRATSSQSSSAKLHAEVTPSVLNPAFETPTQENYTYNSGMSTAKITITANADENVLKIYYGADEGKVTVNHFYRENHYSNGSLIEGTYGDAIVANAPKTFVGNTFAWKAETDHNNYKDWTVDKVTDYSGAVRTGTSLTVDKDVNNNIVNIYYSRVGGPKDADITVNSNYTAYSWTQVGGKWQLTEGSTVTDPSSFTGLPAGSTFTVSTVPDEAHNKYTLTDKRGSGALTTENDSVKMVLQSGKNTIDLDYKWTDAATEPTKASIQVIHHYVLNETTVNENGELITKPIEKTENGMSVADAHMGDSVAVYNLLEDADYNGVAYTSDTTNQAKLTTGTLTAGVNTIDLYYNLTKLPATAEILVHHIYRDVTEVTTTDTEMQMQDILDENGNPTGEQKEVEVVIGTKTETVYTEKDSKDFQETATWYVGQKYPVALMGKEGYSFNETASGKLEIFPLTAANEITLYYDSASTDVDKRDDASIDTKHEYKTTLTSIVGGVLTDNQVSTVTKDGKAENSLTNPEVKAGVSYTAEEVLTYDGMTYPGTAYTRDTTDEKMTVILQKGTNSTLLVKYSRAVTDLTPVTDYAVKHTYKTSTMTVQNGVAGYYDAPVVDTVAADVGAGPFYKDQTVTLPDGMKAGFTANASNPALTQTLKATGNAFELVYETKVPLGQATMTVNHHYTTVSDAGSTTQTTDTTTTKYIGESATANADLKGFALQHFTVDGGAQQTGDTYTVSSLAQNVVVDFYYSKDTRTPATYSIGHVYINVDWDGKETTLPIQYEVENAASYMGNTLTASPNLATDESGKLLYTLVSATATNNFESESDTAYVTKLADGHNEIVFTYKRNVDSRQATTVKVNHHYTALDTYTKVTSDEGTVPETFTSYVDSKLDFDGTGIYVGASYTATLRTTNGTHTDYKFDSSTPENYTMTLAVDADGSVNVIDITYVRTFTTDPGPGPNPTPDPDPNPNPNPNPGGGGDGDDGGYTPPTVTVPDENVPLGTLPSADEVIPEEEVPLAELPDEEVPLAEAPKTGDQSTLWLALAGCSAAGIAILAMGKKKEEDTLDTL